MYRYYNANALGKDVDDCTIRAISCATNRSWDYVYEYLSDIAQSQGMMMSNREFIINYLDDNYERIPHIRGTVGEISKKYKDNILLITMKGHIVCSKYGIVYDTFNSTDRIAEFCWIVD